MLSTEKINNDLEQAIAKGEWAEIERFLRGKRIRPDIELSKTLFAKAVSDPNPKLLAYLSAYEADRLDAEFVRKGLREAFGNPQAIEIANQLLKDSIKTPKWELINVLCTLEEKLDEGLIYSLFDVALRSSKSDTVEKILNLNTVNKLNSEELGRGLILLMRLPNPSEGFSLFRKKQIHFIIAENNTEPQLDSLQNALEIAAQKKDLGSLHCLWDNKERNKLNQLTAQMLESACNKLFHFCVVHSKSFTEYQEIFSYFWEQIARHHNKPIQFAVDQSLKQADSLLIEQYLISLIGEIQPSEEAKGDLFVKITKNLNTEKDLNYALTLLNDHQLDQEASSKALAALSNNIHSALSWQLIQLICKKEGLNRPTEETIRGLLKTLFNKNVNKAMTLCEQLQRLYPATINEAIKERFNSAALNSQLKSYVQEEQWGFAALLLEVEGEVQIEESSIELMYQAARVKNPDLVKKLPKLLTFEQELPEKTLAKQREAELIQAQKLQEEALAQQKKNEELQKEQQRQETELTKQLQIEQLQALLQRERALIIQLQEENRLRTQEKQEATSVKEQHEEQLRAQQQREASLRQQLEEEQILQTQQQQEAVRAQQVREEQLQAQQQREAALIQQLNEEQALRAQQQQDAIRIQQEREAEFEAQQKEAALLLALREKQLAEAQQEKEAQQLLEKQQNEGAEQSAPIPVKTKISNIPLSMMIIGGFIGACGIAAVALAFTLLNALSLGTTGLIVASIGAAAIVSGIGLFAAGAAKNKAPAVASDFCLNLAV